MHASVMAFVREVVEKHGLRDTRVLEIGSLNVNGSVRPIFGETKWDERLPYQEQRYVGIDIRDGPAVDVVMRARDIGERFPAEWADVVVCCEMLEHDDDPLETMRQIAHVLRKGGRLIVTTRGIGFQLHEYPSDYWRFTEAAARDVLAPMAGLDPKTVEVRADPQASGVFMTGVQT
jgi:SAM-dependent methyltransferase